MIVNKPVQSSCEAALEHGHVQDGDVASVEAQQWGRNRLVHCRVLRIATAFVVGENVRPAAEERRTKLISKLELRTVEESLDGET